MTGSVRRRNISPWAAPHPGPPPNPPPAYQGPLDLTSTPAVVAYGQRALSAAKLGSALYTIRRDSDNATQSFNSDAVTGDAPVSAISAFIGAGNGFVATWNDQSGNASDLAQATTTLQPGWVASSQGSRPSFSLPGSAGSGAKPRLASAGTVTLTGGAYTAFVIANKTAAAPDQNQIYWAIVGDINNGPYAYNGVVTSNDASADEYVGDRADANFDNECGEFSVDQTPTSGFVLFDIASQFGNTTIAVNGAVLGGSPTDFNGPVSTLMGDIYIGSDDVPTDQYFFNGHLQEIIIFAMLLDNTDRAAIRQNIANYYGITLS